VITSLICTVTIGESIGIAAAAHGGSVIGILAMLIDLYYTDYTTFLYITVIGGIGWYGFQCIRGYKIMRQMQSLQDL
jgi:hypothetical protein